MLNYLASQDDECRLLQVGDWSRMTGYALAFPHHSKFKNMFDSKILELRENGKNFKKCLHSRYTFIEIVDIPKITQYQSKMKSFIQHFEFSRSFHW